MFIRTMVIILFIATLPTTVYARGSFTPSETRCRAVLDEIDNINSRMRNGYDSREGERLRNKLRELKKQKAACSKARLPKKR